MATVYRARHLAFDEIRAIKVVASRLSDDEDFLKRFRNEAVVARRLHHPHAVRVEDFDTTEDGRPFIVMEYVDGLNLREKIRRDGAVSLRRSVTIARQVASALAAAHDIGIVHRDIKPDNILLTGSGDAEVAKVLDFGIAKVKEGFAGGPEAVATRTGTVVGTPQYISPEQAIGRRGDELDGRADLYSLGVVLYEMVTGRLPFESDTAMGIILQHLQTPPRPPHELRPDLGIPEHLSAVLLQSLQKDRDRRFRTAAAMVAALDAVLALPLPERAAAVPFATPPPQRPATPRPVPADIEDRETRALPRTPPAGSPDTGAAIAMGAAAAPLLSSPPPGLTLPPVPATPPPAGPTPPPMSRTLPPLPMPTQIGSYGPKKKRRRWIFWAIAGFFFWAIFIKEDSRTRRARETPSPSPSAEAAPAVAGADEDPDVKDARLRAEVQRALYDEPKTRTQPITVDVDEGEVTLEGRTSTMEAALEAEGLARRVPGVTDVRNRIEHPEPEHGRAFPHIQISIPPLPDFRKLVPKEAVDEMVKEGRTKLNNGEPEAALHVFQAALALDPRNPDAREGLKEASQRIRTKAREERDRARAREERGRDRGRPSGLLATPTVPPPPSPPDR
jgi:serine/threonine protein kinase